MGQTLDRNGIKRRHQYTAVHTPLNATTNSSTPAAQDTTQEAQRDPTVWLYGLALANYDPPPLLHHFLAHHLVALAIHPTRALLLINLNPMLPAVTSLDALHVVATTHGVHPHRWLGQFDAWAHTELQLRILAHVPVVDWVLLARMDEFLQPPDMTLAALVKTAQGTWIQGRLRDRVAATGQREVVGESLSTQFSLRCCLLGHEETQVTLFQVGNTLVTIPPARFCHRLASTHIHMSSRFLYFHVSFVLTLSH